ncbi:recombinase family protein [Paenibacillus shenyangensis]|uniref:recombinase family protein n=1 Tax=Paenibacillus sp. A9 TaxID=1284352 RepID=UPI00036977C9|nr:recombinase family protein [Paenibacillus sp. A9]
MNEVIEAIGYIRQSDERSDKEDISEQTQLKKIQEYCDYHGFKLVGVFKDIDYSGFRINYTKRPGIMGALSKLKTPGNRIKKFVVYNLSRVTRLKQDFGYIHSSLAKLNVDICSASESLDFGSPSGRLVAGILVDFNEYYSDNLSDITMQSKKTNAEKGRWNGGPPPYGLKKEGDRFIVDEPAATVIREIFKMALDGKGPFIITNWLNDQGFKMVSGAEWSVRRVRYVLSNSTYAGMQHWEGEYYPLKDCDYLIEWSDFQFIQNTRFAKGTVWRGHDDRQLLSSILRCPLCGSKMHARRVSSRLDTRRYICSKKNSTGKCACPSFDLESLDQAVLKLLTDTAKQRFSSHQIMSALSDKEDSENNSKKSSLAKLQQEYQILDAAKQKVFDDYYLNSKLSEEQFGALMKRYESRQKEIDLLLEKVPLPTKKEYGDYDDILETLAGDALLSLPADKRRISIELLIHKIIPGSPAEVHFKWGDVQEIPVQYTKRKGSTYFY